MKLFPLLLCLASLQAAASGFDVQERLLGNGLKVLVKPDHRAPIVTSQIWYKVGSSYEHGGLTGISHVLEHMMFKGTDRLAPGQFSRIIAENGGNENAFTGRDYTAYFQTLARDRLEIAFELEAERMRHLALRQDELAKEVEVVREERRLRTEDDPQSLTLEQFNAAAYEVSPYRIPVIGWPGDLQSLTLQDVREWYRRWYAPDNATLVVVGDVQPEAVFALAQKYFGPLKAEQVPPPKARPEPPQRGEKRILVKAPAKQPYLIIGYKATSLTGDGTDWEPYALEMLASVLDGGSSARFTRELIRGSRIAASAGAGYSAFTRLSDMLVISAIPAKGRTVQELEGALLAQVQRLRNEPVPVGELERIRKQLLAGKVYELDSIHAQAMQIGLLETVGLGWPLADRQVDHLSRVTPEQIQAVARKYLVADNRTVALLQPLPLEDEQPHPTGSDHTAAERQAGGR